METHVKAFQTLLSKPYYAELRQRFAEGKMDAQFEDGL
jgi:hypothetical protein